MSNYEYTDSQKNDPTETNPVWETYLWLVVSTSGFDNSLSRPPSATAARREGSIAGVRHSFKDSDGAYGYHRIHADLNAEGNRVFPCAGPADHAR